MNIDRLAANLDTVRRRLRSACERVGRDPASVRLVAVTKTVGPDTARALVGLGVGDIAENRVQEAASKQAALVGVPVRWHMIGHLQTNKAGQAVRMFDLIHSVDSVRLAQALDKQAAAAGKAVRVLVQVNVSGEESKFGVPAEAAIGEIRRIAECPALRVEGLMTMAPLVDDAEKVRPLFVQLRCLAEEIRALEMPGVEMKHLSMGMTQDYEVAVEEGATLVRIGTALFRDV